MQNWESNIGKQAHIVQPQSGISACRWINASGQLPAAPHQEKNNGLLARFHRDNYIDSDDPVIIVYSPPDLTIITQSN